MLNLYSIFVYYVLFFQKKLPPLPPIFQLMWGVLPTLPPSETASDPYSHFKTFILKWKYKIYSEITVA